MASAIVQGLLPARTQGAPALRATTNSAESAAKYADLDGLEVTALADDENANLAAVDGADLILLGVKPWAIAEVLGAVAEKLAKGATVVSVAAGVTLAAMRKALGERDDVAVVRAMPNTPSFIGQGVTGIAAEPDGREEAIELARDIFENVGEVLVLEEERIDALSAVSGSGPAYLFWFVEEMIAGAKRLGFNAEEAQLLAQQTVTGAAALLAQSDKSAPELRRQVTSPRGTTEQAVRVFSESNFNDTIDRAFAAAVARAKELAES